MDKKEVLHSKIKAVYAVNQEIIARVENLTDVVRYAYHLRPKGSNTEAVRGGVHVPEEFEVEEAATEIKVLDILKDHRVNADLAGELITDVWDVFNDKPNWKVETWEDLKRLNGEVRAIVDKFELLIDIDKVTNELAKYLRNLEIVQAMLGEVEIRTLSEESRKNDFSDDLTQLNLILARMKGKGMRFVSKLSWAFSDSTIVDGEQSAVLEKWYGRGWNLLYRASRDGWTTNDFHSRCDGKGPTVVIVRALYSGCIFGGYLDQSWHSKEAFINSTHASVFTLTNEYGTPPVRFSPGNATYAAYGGTKYGPNFGGGDLVISGDANVNNESFSCFPQCYVDSSLHKTNLLAGSFNFKVSEIEVFSHTSSSP